MEYEQLGDYPPRTAWVRPLVLLVLVIAGIVWEVAAIRRNSSQISATINSFYEAHRDQDLEKAWAQLLPPQQGGERSKDELARWMNSNWKYMAQLYLTTECLPGTTRIWPTLSRDWQIVPAAVMDASLWFDSLSGIDIRVFLQKRAGKWYIARIEQIAFYFERDD